jgi:hypothetical protein
VGLEVLERLIALVSLLSALCSPLYALGSFLPALSYSSFCKGGLRGIFAVLFAIRNRILIAPKHAFKTSELLLAAISSKHQN